MSGADPVAADAAIASARRMLGLGAEEPARAWPVARMNPRAPGYWLVVFGAAQRATALAAVGESSGEVLESARLPGRERHVPMDAGDAIARAGLGPGARARLVWDPSPASRSRFFPLWEVQSAGRTIWVDSIRGEVWQSLEAARGGGSGGA